MNIDTNKRNISTQLQTPGELAVELSHGKWIFHKHLQYLDEIIHKAIVSGNKKLIINMPPRHGKSCFLSEWLPLWYLHKFSNKQIILSTYSQKFANLWGRRVKDLIKEHGNLFNIGIRKDVSSANNFSLNTGGGMVCIGAGGSLTGRGADLLLIDDPIKNDAEANSLTYRDAIWNWFNSTAYTRIEPGGTLVLIMTRWHEDDLCGRLLRQHPDMEISSFANNNSLSYTLFSKSTQECYNQSTHDSILNAINITSNKEWILVRIPAIALENDPLGRAAGQALWDTRFGIKQLDEIREQIGEYWFSALYQQAPAIATGNIFKRKTFRYFYHDKATDCYILNDTRHNFTASKAQVASQQESLFGNNSLENSSLAVQSNIGSNVNRVNVADCSVYAVVDLAATVKQTSDYTVILVFAITPGQQILILDVIRAKFEGSEHLDLLKELYVQWRPVMIGIESVQYQISLIQMARKQNLPIKELRPDKDKVSRCLPMNSFLESGRVFFDADGAWVKAFEEELLAFPKGKHDDQVDAFGYINNMLAPIMASNQSYCLLVGGKKKR